MPSDHHLIRQACKRVCVCFVLLKRKSTAARAESHTRLQRDARRSLGSHRRSAALFTVAALLQIAGIVLSQILISQIQDEITSVS